MCKRQACGKAHADVDGTLWDSLSKDRVRQEGLQTVGSAGGQGAGLQIWKGRQCSTEAGANTCTIPVTGGATRHQQE